MSKYNLEAIEERNKQESKGREKEKRGANSPQQDEEERPANGTICAKHMTAYDSYQNGDMVNIG